MTEQQQNPAPNNDDEVVPIPPKGSGGGGSKVLLIILGLFVACVLVFGVLLTAGAWFVKNRTADVIRGVAKTQGVDIEDFDVDAGKGKVRIKTGSGEAVSSSGPELPEGFPTEYITVYDGKIKGSNRFKSGDGTSWSVIVETSDDSDAIKQSVQKTLEDNEWKSVMEQDSDNTHMRVAKNEPYTATISWGKSNDDGIRRVSYNIIKSSPKE